MAAKKKTAPEVTSPPAPAPTPKYGEWKQVFADEREMRSFFDDFSEAVAEDIRELAAARRRSEEVLLRGL